MLKLHDLKYMVRYGCSAYLCFQKAQYVRECLLMGRITKLLPTGGELCLLGQDFKTEPPVVLVDSVITLFTSSTALKTLRKVCETNIGFILTTRSK